MASVGEIGAAKQFSRMIHVSGEFDWPMTWDAWYEYTSNHFTIGTIFQFFGMLASSLLFGFWVYFRFNEKFLTRGYHLMFLEVIGQPVHS